MTGSSLRQTTREGELIRLRPLSREDLPLTLKWRNDYRSLRWFKSGNRIEHGSHLAWYESYAKSDSKDVLYFAETLDGVPVGQTSIYNFSDNEAKAEVGRFVSDPEHRGKGLFREALVATLDIGFREAALTEMFLEVLESNERAINLYRSVGFADTSPPVDGLLPMTLTVESFRKMFDGDSRWGKRKCR